MTDFTTNDTKNQQKFEELRAEAQKYAKLVEKAYNEFYALGGEGMLVYSVKEYEAYWGDAYLYANNKWAFLDSTHPDYSWLITVTEDGIFEALKRAYLCETHQIESDWDIPVKHFRRWMERLEKET